MPRPLNSALLVAASLSLAPAYAEEREQDEIVVTATRTPSSIERLPTRVEVISRDQIEAQSLATLAQALGGEVVQGGGAGQQASLFLRGANSKHALALFDGVRLNDASNPNGQYDFGQDTLGGLARVEVVRGPASAIYGSDAIGGAVNLIPRRDGDGAYGEFTLGSWATVRGLLGAGAGAGGFSYGFSAEAFETDGHDLVPDRMTTSTGDPDGASASTLTANARYERGAVGVDALVRVRRSEASFDTFSGGAFFDLRADDPDLENEASQSLWRIGADLTADTALKVRIAAGEVESDRAERDGGLSTSRARSAREFADVLALYNGEAATLTAGLSFEREAIRTRPQFAAPLRVGEKHAAAYLVAQIEPASTLTLTGSLRVDDYENFGSQATYGFGGVARIHRLRLYASYGTAFKAPSLSERFETSAFNTGNPDLAPERSQSWELGGDWEFARDLSLGGAYYQTDLENLIEYDFLRAQNLNVGAAEIAGAEAYVQAAPSPWISARLAYTWSDARNRLSGAPLARRPAHTWRLDLELKPETRWRLGLSWSAIGARTDVTYDDAGAFLSSAGRTSGFDVGALWARYELSDSGEIFARIDNLADAAYEQSAGFAGAPRSFQFGVRTRF